MVLVYNNKAIKALHNDDQRVFDFVCINNLVFINNIIEGTYTL